MTSDWDFSDLRAVYVNCTLKRSPEVSNTQGLADKSIAILERHGVAVGVIRAVDHEIATGVHPDMTEHGWERDDWPALFEKVIAADILVLLSPIWLGEKSSVCTQVIEPAAVALLRWPRPLRFPLPAPAALPADREQGNEGKESAQIRDESGFRSGDWRTGSKMVGVDALLHP
jgi:NADPH-dependent FMN reductase